VYPHGEQPLNEYLRTWARLQPDKPALVYYDHTLSYAELDRASDRMAALAGRARHRAGRPRRGVPAELATVQHRLLPAS
jgi:fatty-acyl-CoA synthase/long-chain acyl-CoA synthetase